jgi:Ca2+-binding EF-hand superfamily protein
LNYPLPSEILADLQDAFKFYDKEDSGVISITHFRNILHNFGFHKMTKKEIDDELKKNDIDPNKRTSVDFDAVRLAIAYRWNKGGKEEEARECFRLFDKREKNYITVNDLKAVLPHYLEFPVTDTEI